MLFLVLEAIAANRFDQRSASPQVKQPSSTSTVSLSSLDALNLETQGTITEVGPQANSATHSFEVKVQCQLPEGIYSGMFGRLKLPLGTEEAILLSKALTEGR